jgi:hypothetical protein
MLSRTIAAFCIIDDALQAMGYKDDPQTKVPASSVILTLAILAAMELGGKHNKALALAKDLNLFTYIPSPSRFNRRLHALYPLFLPLLHLLSQVWKNLHQAQAYALDTFPLPACENIRAPRSRLFPHKVWTFPRGRSSTWTGGMRAICTKTCCGRRRGSFPWSSAGEQSAVCALAPVPGHRGAEGGGDGGGHAARQVKSRFLWVFLPRPKAGPCPGNAGKPSPPWPSASPPWPDSPGSPRRGRPQPPWSAASPHG